MSKSNLKIYPVWRMHFDLCKCMLGVHINLYSAQYWLPHNVYNVNLPAPEIVRFVWSALSSPSLYTDPATLPRHEQIMKTRKVILTNYSLLWQHLYASKVLPKLVDESIISEKKKKEVESYQQSHGQNTLIIDALLTVECAPEGLLTICDMLQTTSEKEYIAQHILRGAIQSVFRFRLVGAV